MPDDRFWDRAGLTALCPAGRNNWFVTSKMISGIGQQQSVSNGRGWKLFISIKNCRIPRVTSVNMAQGFEEDNFNDHRIKNIKNPVGTLHVWAPRWCRYSLNPHKKCFTNYCYWKWIKNIVLERILDFSISLSFICIKKLYFELQFCCPRGAHLVDLLYCSLIFKVAM